MSRTTNRLASTARTNKVAIACCDRAGVARGQQWTEGTAIIDPDGWVVASAGPGRAMVVADVKLGGHARQDAHRVRRPVRRPPRRPLLARKRLEDLPVVQMRHELSAVANIQGDVGDSRSKALLPARVDEFVARPRPYLDRYRELLGNEPTGAPRPDTRDQRPPASRRSCLTRQPPGGEPQIRHQRAERLLAVLRRPSQH